jgi:hypothetical protein
MNKRGWLASGFLAAAVIGGYLGLLPLLSSLASGPAWPEPIATRDASGVVTVAAAGDAAAETQVAPSADGATEVVREQPKPGAADQGESTSEPEVVSVVVGGDLDRVEQPKKKRPAPADGGSSSGSPSGTPSGSSGSSGGSGGGNAVTPAAPQAPPATDPWSEFDGAGEFASPDVGNAGSDDDTIISGP